MNKDLDLFSRPISQQSDYNQRRQSKILHKLKPRVFEMQTEQDLKAYLDQLSLFLDAQD